jgi:hypothetical protein
MVASLAPITSLAAIGACENTYPSQYVKTVLLGICRNLLELDAKSTLWKAPPAKPDVVSLAMLHERLQAGKPSPTPHVPKPPVCEQEQQPKAPPRTGKTPMNRPVEDFEHLYYAMLAKIQEICQLLHVRVNNGFTASTYPLFHNGPSLLEVNARLHESWAALNDPALVKVLDSAIRRSRVKSLHADVLGQLERGEITEGDARELVQDLYSSQEDGEISGLAWIGGWPPAMIGAWLKEKFRVLLQGEKRNEEAARNKAHAEEAQRRSREQKEAAFTHWFKNPNEEEQRHGRRLTAEFHKVSESVQGEGRRLRQSAEGKTIGIDEQGWREQGWPGWNGQGWSLQ